MLDKRAVNSSMAVSYNKASITLLDWHVEMLETLSEDWNIRFESTSSTMLYI